MSGWVNHVSGVFKRPTPRFVPILYLDHALSDLPPKLILLLSDFSDAVRLVRKGAWRQITERQTRQGPREIQRVAIPKGPLIEYASREPQTVFTANALWLAAFSDRTVQDIRDLMGRRAGFGASCRGCSSLPPRIGRSATMP